MKLCKLCESEIRNKGNTVFCSMLCMNTHRQKAKPSIETRKKKERDRAREYRKLMKQKSVDYLGSKCVNCGYCRNIKALEFHHKNPDEKDFSISKATTVKMSWEKIKNELDKCALLCSNCHREEHDIY